MFTRVIMNTTNSIKLSIYPLLDVGFNLERRYNAPDDWNTILLLCVCNRFFYVWACQNDSTLLDENHKQNLRVVVNKLIANVDNTTIRQILVNQMSEVVG